MLKFNNARNVSRHLLDLAIRIRKDRRGVAAVEFALILPVMLLTYFASAEVTKGVLASRRVTMATRTMADLLGQQSATIDKPTLDLIVGAATPVLSPLPTTSTNLQITLSSVTFKANGSNYDARTDWTYGYNSGTPRPCQVLNQVANDAPPASTDVPTGFYGPGSIVVADVTYNYPTPFNINIGSWKSPPIVVFKRAMFFAPRNTTSIAFKGSAAGVTVCTYAP